MAPRWPPPPAAQAEGPDGAAHRSGTQPFWSRPAAPSGPGKGWSAGGGAPGGDAQALRRGRALLPDWRCRAQQIPAAFARVGREAGWEVGPRWVWGVGVHFAQETGRGDWPCGRLRPEACRALTGSASLLLAGKSLKTLMSKGILQVHPPICDCPGCRISSPVVRCGARLGLGVTPPAELVPAVFRIESPHLTPVGVLEGAFAGRREGALLRVLPALVPGQGEESLGTRAPSQCGDRGAVPVLEPPLGCLGAASPRVLGQGLLSGRSNSTWAWHCALSQLGGHRVLWPSW